MDDLGGEIPIIFGGPPTWVLRIGTPAGLYSFILRWVWDLCLISMMNLATTFRWGVVGGGLHISEDQVFRSVVGLQQKSRFVFIATHSPFFLKRCRPILFALTGWGSSHPLLCRFVWNLCAVLGWISVEIRSESDEFFQECSVTSFVACQGLLMATWSAN